eukprot:3958514-Amphidinium_carterae.2
MSVAQGSADTSLELPSEQLATPPSSCARHPHSRIGIAKRQRAIYFNSPSKEGFCMHQSFKRLVL